MWHARYFSHVACRWLTYSFADADDLWPMICFCTLLRTHEGQCIFAYRVHLVSFWRLERNVARFAIGGSYLRKPVFRSASYRINLPLMVGDNRRARWTVGWWVENTSVLSMYLWVGLLDFERRRRISVRFTLESTMRRVLPDRETRYVHQFWRYFATSLKTHNRQRLSL